MAKNPVALEINIQDMTVKQQMEAGKVLVVVLDGEKGKATMIEAPDHGFTVVETVKGKSARIKLEHSFLI